MNVVYLFDTFRLCPARRELKRGTQFLELPANAFDCLVYLIQHRDRAVGRDELISAVWGRIDISESLLPQTVVRIRRALGDDSANAQRSIRTITKFGYHWIAETSLEKAVAVAETGASGQIDRAPSMSLSSSSQSSATKANAGDDVIVMPAEVDSAIVDAEWMRLAIMDLVGCHLRHANVPVTHTEDVIVMLHIFPSLAQARIDDERELPLRAPRRVYPMVRRDEQAWLVELISRNGQGRVTVSAADADVTVAARKAADALLSALNA